MSKKAPEQKPTRPNAHLEERFEAVKNGTGKLLKPKKAKAKPEPEPTAIPAVAEAAPAAPPVASPRGTIPVPRDAHPGTYGLMVDEGGLGLHAAPGASIIVEPLPPTGAGLAVFYLKDRPGPVIFDLTRNFIPELALPFAPGSEVMPLIEMIEPNTGQFGRLRADKVEKMHRVMGVYTPHDVALTQRPFPAKLPEFDTCPEGMGEHYIEDGSAYPLVRPGEVAIFDPSQREPANAGLFVLEWSNGTRNALETNLRPISRDGEEMWFVDPVNRPPSKAALERRLQQGMHGGPMFASDGPYFEDRLRERIVGRVVGVLAPQRHPRGDDQDTTAEALPASVPTPPPAPGSEEARAAWHAACREHSSRTAPLNDCPDLMRAGHEVWTTQSLLRAMETGEITVAEFARLQPIASERELRFAEIAHELNIGGLFALAYAGEYPLAQNEDTPASVEPDPIFAVIERHRAARAATIGLDDGKDKEGYEDAHDARMEALEAVESTRPTTIAGLLALARHMDRYLREDAGSDRYTDASADGFALSALINACLSLSKPTANVAAFDTAADPIFAAIRKHADARAVFSATVNPQDTAWVRQNGGDTSDEAMAPARAAYEAACAAEMQAWGALFETQPTTLPGVLALLRHCQAWAPSNDGQADAPAMEDVFGFIADSLEAVAAAASPEVTGHPCESDPVFAAIAASQQAEDAMAAFDNDPEASRAQNASEIEDQLSGAQGAAFKAVLATTPTTTAGLRALVEYTKKQNELILGDDWRSKALQDDFGDVYLSLVAAIEALHGTPAERDEPVTVENAASLSFQAYTFDMPLRSPQEWAGEFTMHAIAMHIGDKTLRMTKPELMAFVRDAAKRGDDTDGIMWKALNAASSTFDGWAKFLHLASTRYLIAGASAAIEPDTEEGGA